MKVAIGSKNPVKIQSVKEAFELAWPNKKWQFIGVDVKSGVSDQPMSDLESIKGAKTRAKRALKALDGDFGVGLEGGLQKVGKDWFDAGWIAVINKAGQVGIGSTVRMITPSKMMKLIKGGMELGLVNDKLFGINNSKHGDGHFGLMTNNIITRSSGYRDGVVTALVRFLKPEVF